MLAAVTTAPAALAGTHTGGRTYLGWIKAAHPGLPVTLLGAPCHPRSPLNGVDGVWYQVPRGATHVRMTPARTLDASVLFYTVYPGGTPAVVSADGGLGGGCRFVSGIFGRHGIYGNGFGGVASGSVPAGASFVIVNGYMGTGTFTLMFS
jgi:hypothetical protein